MVAPLLPGVGEFSSKEMPAPSLFGLPGPGPVLCPAFGDAGTAGGSVPAGAGGRGAGPGEGVGGRRGGRPLPLVSPFPGGSGPGPACPRRVSLAREVPLAAGLAPALRPAKRVKSA